MQVPSVKLKQIELQHMLRPATPSKQDADCTDAEFHACCGADGGREAEEVQMELLFAELKRIEGQQQMLKTAVAQNKQLVVMPPAGFNADDMEDEYAEEVVAKPDPDRFIPSGADATHTPDAVATG